MSDFRLSVSKSKTFLQCKKQYHFAYILKLPQKDQTFHIFGRFLHSVLELFYLSYINGSVEPFHKEMAIAFKAAQKEYQGKISPENIKEAYEIIDKYLQKLAEEKKYQPSVLAVEKHFKVAINERVALTGMIDKIQQDPDGILHVIDYKTTKNKKYLQDDWFQLLTYAWVLLQEDPTIEKVRGSYVLLRHNFEFMTKEFSREEILAVQNQYQSYAEQMETENKWEPTPTFLCTYCSFLEHCEQGKTKVEKVGTKIVKHGETKW